MQGTGTLKMSKKKSLKTSIKFCFGFARLVCKMFVCRRKLLTTLLKTPYETINQWDMFSQWKIAVILFEGAYYMCQFDRVTPNKESNQSGNSEWVNSLYW
ncbi:hypothetical protein DPMN_169723 [Dreissena polymorpha]|uniref:Uncharacterized protein n=1 Tax=Dreissena polymorpha TaxID=45954 RepID=A0A9D4DXX5_DREPO|nr:hypothetical protein DPMN_169723 [Dreissena polymorpha]